MSNEPDKQRFESAYSGEAPWDIDGPQPSFMAVADRITGSLLDAGCGTGENALFFAGRGVQTTGIDFLSEPIRRAKQKAADRGIPLKFEVMDALTLEKHSIQYDNVIDSGLFHVFSDADRQRYVAGLAHVLKPGGHLFIMCFSDSEPGEIGPRRISKTDLAAAFADGWTIESIEPTAFRLNPKFTDAEFSPGGPKSWFVIARRK
jgi:cyclopropane fatty-acyl-phospholipid synthase-like methyltransferase